MDLIYSIASDTLEGVVFDVELGEELYALTLSSVTIQNVAIDVDGDEIKVVLSGTPIQSDQNAVAAAVGAHGLNAAKKRKTDAIDARSIELEEDGFVSNGNRFKMRDADQSRAAGLRHVATDPGISYPVKVNTFGNQGSVELTNPAAFNNWHKDMLLAVRGIRDAGTTLKDSVRAATTVAQVLAIVDNR